MALLRALIATAAAVVLGAATLTGSESDGALEYQVKAAFLYNFAKFVEWPAAEGNSGSPVVLGILGKDPFGGILEQTIAGKTINGRPLALVRLTGMDGLKRCHILFISSSERARLPQVLEALGNASVLTVSEMEGFARAGGMIAFAMRGNKVHLEIDAEAARRAGLQISSKLLSLSTVVSPQSRRGGS